MSDLILPSRLKPKPRQNVQISGLERVVALVHKDTNRILCFGRDDWMTKKLAAKMGCKVIELLHAADYDRYAKMWREQSKEETAAEDHAYLERENYTRGKLRAELRKKLTAATSGRERMAIESALRTLDSLEARRQRYRAESFMVNEAFEESKSEIGQQLVEQIMTPRGY
jgi:hypothetical protein